MRDALRARQQGIGELLRRHAGVAFDILEPFGGIARGVLDLQHFHAAAGLVALQRLGQHIDAAGAGVADIVGQVDRVFQRQLGAGADREMRGVRGIAHQHHRHAAAVGQRVPAHPGAADHAREADPDSGAAQVGGVADQAVAIEVAREQALAVGHALLLAHLLDAGSPPHRLGRLDNEGRGVVVKAIGMRLEPAVLGLLEGEGERLEQLVRAEPDKAALAGIDVGLEGVGIAPAHAAVDAVGGDDEIGPVLLRECLVVRHVGLEDQVHAELLATLLQDIEQALAADADEAVPARADGASADMDVNVIPVIERRVNPLCADRIGLFEIVHGGVGEHHAPAEGVVGTVAFHHIDLVGRVLQLHQQTEIQARGAATDTQHSHLVVSCAPVRRQLPWDPAGTCDARKRI